MREYGVGFAVRNPLLDKIQLGASATDRLISLQLNTTDRSITMLYVYSPTLTAAEEVKDDFYSRLETMIKGFPNPEILIILGDFNASVGSDNEAWPNCIGHFGIGKCNENGERLLELCNFNGLCITNNFLQCQISSQSVLETSTIKTLAPAGPNSYQM